MRLLLLLLLGGLALSLAGREAFVGKWNFDDSEHFYQSPITGVTLQGSATAASGIVGQAVRFDGVDDYLEVAFPDHCRPRVEMTLAFWFKADPGAVSFPALRHRTTNFAANGSDDFSWYEVSTETGKRFYGGYAHTQRLKPEVWYHFAMTYSQKEIVIFLNGRRIHSTPAENGGAVRNTPEPMAIGGKLFRHQGNWGGFFQGVIDEIEVLNYAKSDFPRVRLLILREQLLQLADAVHDASWQAEVAALAHAAAEKDDAESLREEPRAKALLAEGLRLYRRKFRPDAASQANFEVIKAHSLKRIMPGDFLFTPPVEKVTVSVAGNERENFQLIVIPESDSFAGVEVSLPESLVGPEGRQYDFALAVSEVEYTPLAKPSAYMYELSVIPDRLRGGSEFSLGELGFLPLWLEVTAPAGIPGGMYSGQIRLTSRDGSVRVVSLEVKVWDFELPQSNIVPSLVSIWERDIQSYVTEENPEKFVELLSAYAHVLLEHRLNPVIMHQAHLVAPWLRTAVYPDYQIGPDGNAQINWKYFDLIVDSLREAGMSQVVIGPYYRDSGYWLESAAKFDQGAIWRAVRDHAAAKGYLPEALAYAIDEWGDLTAQANQVGDMLSTHAPGLKWLVTGGSSNYPTDLLRNVGLWVPQLHWVNMPEMQRQQARGVPVWFYTSSGPQFPAPNLHSDTPPAGIRMVPGVGMRFGFDGMLHWAANFNTYKNVSTPVLEYGAGEGTYLYADAEGYPVPTIRLKILADGMEDWTALRMLQECDPAAWRRMVDRLAELIPAEELDPAMEITMAEPREATYHTFLKTNTFYPVYDRPEVYLEWREELYTQLSAARKNQESIIIQGD